MSHDKLASTHRQVVLNEVEDNISTDENPRASDAGAAVHRDRPPVVHRPQVTDETNQLLRTLRDAVVGPVCELQVKNKMGLASLRDKTIDSSSIQLNCQQAGDALSSLTSVSTMRMTLMWKYSRCCWFSRWILYLPVSSGTPSFSGQYT